MADLKSKQYVFCSPTNRSRGFSWSNVPSVGKRLRTPYYHEVVFFVVVCKKCHLKCFLFFTKEEFQRFQNASPWKPKLSPLLNSGWQVLVHTIVFKSLILVLGRRGYSFKPIRFAWGSSPKLLEVPHPTPNNNFTSLKHFKDSRFSLLRCLLLVWYLLMNMNTLGRKTRGFGTARTLVKERYHPFHNETDYVIASFVDSCC